MTAFRALMGAADAIIDGTHAEHFRLLPMTMSQYGGRQPDQTRQVREFMAVLSWPAEAADIGAHAELTARQPRLSVRETALPPDAVRVGDSIEAIDRPGLSFEVMGIRPEGMTRTVIELSVDKSA